MTTPRATHPTLEERRAVGERARGAVPPSSHAGWTPSTGRADPVDLLEEQNRSRDADLVPVRHGRMLASAFTFYRGSALIMAEDLWRTPTAGLDVQLCGDAHLSNFGLFASPERALVFDINDFDETLPGPFEYDVKRLAASFTIAARNNGYDKAEVRSVTRASVKAYREAMASFAEMKTLDVWYAHLSENMIMESIAGLFALQGSAKGQKELKRRQERAGAIARKARSRDSLSALSKLGEFVDGRYRIVSQPPFIVPVRDFATLYPELPENADELIAGELVPYAATLRPELRSLLARFELVDAARKVVGVGSVGTRAYIALLQGRDERDPLFLQLKEAKASVLEKHLPRSRYERPAQRVVHGQRMMQASSDIFLGWTDGILDAERSYYWRQLRDMKGSIEVTEMKPAGMTFYASLCGWTLARAHARSGDPVAIAQYLGADDAFDAAITDFAKHYARQNDRDYEAFADAVRTGRIEAVTEFE